MLGKTTTAPTVLPMTEDEIAEYGALCVANRQRSITAREALREYLELHPQIMKRASQRTLEVALIAALMLWIAEVGDEDLPRAWRKWIKAKAKTLPDKLSHQDAIDLAIKGLP